MNIIAGVVLGLIEESYLDIFIISFIWGLFHCVYGYFLNLHINIIVLSTRAGKPILSYFIARFLTGTTTAFISATFIFVIRSLFDIKSIGEGFDIPKIETFNYLTGRGYVFVLGLLILFFFAFDSWVQKNFENYSELKTTFIKMIKTKGAISQILNNAFRNKS